MFRSMRFDAPGVHPINSVHIILLNVRKKIMLKNAINAQNFLAKIEEMLRRSDEYEKKCREVCTDEEYQMLKSSFFNKEVNLQK